MHCRAVRISRDTLIGASNALLMSTSTKVSRNTLSPQCSWTSTASELRASSMSETAGSSSRSSMTAAARSSASARVAATHIAANSPTWRSLSAASGGCSEILNPRKPDTARIGFTPTRSAAVNVAPRWSGGMETPRSLPCATGLRTKATSFIPGSRMSATNWPRPRMRRSSSFLATRAPTPCEDITPACAPAFVTSDRFDAAPQQRSPQRFARSRSAAPASSNRPRSASLLSSAKLAQQSRERFLHALGNGGAEQRAGAQCRCLVGSLGHPRHSPLEVVSEHVGDARRQIADDPAASELRQGSEQERAHRDVDPGRGGALLRAQLVFELATRARGAEPVPARPQDHAALGGGVANDASLPLERSRDRAELDGELPPQPIAPHRAQRGSRHARDHARDVVQEGPHLGLRPGDHKTLADLDVGLFAGETQIRCVEDGAVVFADRSDARQWDLAGHAAAARSDGPQFARRGCGRGERARAHLLQHAADGAHDADITGTSA